jgi:hypothetical protein
MEKASLLPLPKSSTRATSIFEKSSDSLKAGLVASEIFATKSPSSTPPTESKVSLPPLVIKKKFKKSKTRLRPAQDYSTAEIAGLSRIKRHVITTVLRANSNLSDFDDSYLNGLNSKLNPPSTIHIDMGKSVSYFFLKTESPDSAPLGVFNGCRDLIQDDGFQCACDLLLQDAKELDKHFSASQIKNRRYRKFNNNNTELKSCVK